MSRIRIIALIAAGALAATGIGGAIAAATRGEDRKTEQAILDDAAKRLGTTAQELREALGAAVDAHIDQAVRDGRLTREQADALKRRRQESGRVLGLPGPGHPHMLVPGPARPHLVAPGHRAAGLIGDLARALDMTQGRLVDRLRDGDTLAQIAKAQGKSIADVKEAALTAARKRLDQAVEDGELTRAQADHALDHLKVHLSALAHGYGAPRLPRGHHPVPTTVRGVASASCRSASTSPTPTRRTS